MKNVKINNWGIEFKTYKENGDEEFELWIGGGFVKLGFAVLIFAMIFGFAFWR
jgi:hypothetical protein